MCDKMCDNGGFWLAAPSSLPLIGDYIQQYQKNQVFFLDASLNERTM